MICQKKKRHLILDLNSKKLINIFNITDSSSILKTRKEEFNFWIILWSLNKLNSLKLSDLYKAYLKTYILYIKPKLALTYIHNNEIFWEVFKELNIDLYVFQNGYCSPTDILPSQKNTSKNIIFFTLTKERAKILKKNGVQSIPFGSLQSNSIPKIKSRTNNKIVFISQYRQISNDEKRNFKLNNLTYDQYFSYDYNLLEILYEFTKSFNLELYFIGSSPDKEIIKNEKKFFNLKSKKIKYKKRIINLKEKFEFLDKCHMVVGIDSALLYECLGRNIRTFFGTYRGYKEFNFSVRPFLESIPNNQYGDFWTNKFDKALILKILTRMHLNLSTTHGKLNLDQQVPYYNPIDLKLIKKLLD